MELRPPAGPVPEMFRPVRERHPDVDIVLPRPEERPADGAPDAAEPSAGAGLEADLELVARTLGALAEVATGQQPGPDTRIAFGPREDTVLARGRHLATLERSPTAGLATYLSGDGWDLARPGSDHEVLLGRRDGLEVVVSYARTGVLSLTVSSSPRAVGVARARELVRS